MSGHGNVRFSQEPTFMRGADTTGFRHFRHKAGVNERRLIALNRRRIIVPTVAQIGQPLARQ